MTTFIVTVEDEQADKLKKLLQDTSFVKSIVEEEPGNTGMVSEPETAYERIRKILDSAKGKNLFKDIKDPSEWQREIRKEWDRDF